MTNPFWRKLFRWFNLNPVIGGLEISDAFLRFLSVDGEGKITQVSLRLPPGTVSDGAVADAKKLTDALIRLHQQVNRRIIPVVITIGANHVYSQVFNLPFLRPDKVIEAAQLNLRMISPLGVKSVYSDWQLLNDTSVSGGQMDLLGAFIESEVADAYLEAARRAGFSPLALEFAPLSLVRSLGGVSFDHGGTRSSIVLFVGYGGIDFVIVKNSQLYFNRFVHWQEDVAGLITGEINKITNFYYGRWGEVVDTIILIDPFPVAAVRDALKELKLNVQMLTVKKESPEISVSLSKFSSLTASPFWLAALGAALRGLLPRSRDTFISLTKEGTEIEYSHQRLLYFVNFWRNALLTIAGGVFAVNLAALLFLNSTVWQLERAGASDIDEGESKRISLLEDQARAVNQLIAQASAARQQSLDWSSLFTQLWGIAGKIVVINRFHFDPGNLVIVIGGDGPNEIEIINFKNRLLKQSNFEGVSLPLSQIVRNGDRVSFQMSFRAK